jgi:hypothetical protein
MDIICINGVQSTKYCLTGKALISNNAVASFAANANACSWIDYAKDVIDI